MSSRGLNVLLVDDDLEWLEMMKEALDGEGYVVRAAVRGTHALTILESFTPDIVITDLRMPIMGGGELVAKLQARGHQLPPIIIVTGENMVAGSPAFDAAFDVIQKPTSLDRLLGAVAAAAASCAA